MDPNENILEYLLRNTNYMRQTVGPKRLKALARGAKTILELNRVGDPRVFRRLAPDGRIFRGHLACRRTPLGASDDLPPPPPPKPPKTRTPFQGTAAAAKRGKPGKGALFGKNATKK